MLKLCGCCLLTPFRLGMNAISKPTTVGKENIYEEETPETYLGYERMENYASPENISYNNIAMYTFPERLRKNAWALQGAWKVTAEHITSAEKNAALKIHFTARKVFIVMGNSTGSPIEVNLLLNGEKIIKEKGENVVNSSIIVDQYNLYEVLVLPHSSSGILQVISSAPGLDIYTFTFGS